MGVPVSIVDSLKTWGLFLLLFLILAVGLGNWLNPRNPTITPQTVENLQQVSSQLKRVADNMETNSNATTALTQTLARQLTEREHETDTVANELLTRYGLDLTLPTGLPAIGGLYPTTDDLGGRIVPASDRGKGPAGSLPKTTPVFPGAPNGSVAPATNSSFGDATKSAG